MRLITHGNNRTELQYENGTCVFFSYQTPVAGYTPSESYVKTDKWYSSTTTRHVNRWLDGKPAREVSQQFINQLQVN